MYTLFPQTLESSGHSHPRPRRDDITLLVVPDPSIPAPQLTSPIDSSW